MKTRNFIVLVLLLCGASALLARSFFPVRVTIQGPAVQTTVDVSEETRAQYEDRISKLQSDLADAMAASPPINTTDTLWRDSVRVVQLACPAPGDTAAAEPELPPAWYLRQAVFPDEPGDEEGLTSELMLGVGGGMLSSQEQVREVFMAGPITGISQGPDGMQYAFGEWPTPHCSFRTKVEWGVGTVLLVEGLKLIFGGGSSTDVVIHDTTY